MMRIGMMNLVLHGIRHAQIKRANSLSEMGGLSEEDLRRRYKVILSNPPFAGVLPKESIRKDLGTSSKKSELLFLGLVMQSLAPGGRCALPGARYGCRKHRSWFRFRPEHQRRAQEHGDRLRRTRCGHPARPLRSTAKLRA